MVDKRVEVSFVICCLLITLNNGGVKENYQLLKNSAYLIRELRALLCIMALFICFFEDIYG